jgi:hypothetical protein
MSMTEAMARAALEREAQRLGIEPWQLEMARAVPDETIRGLVQDLRRGPAERSGLADGGSEKPRAGAVAVERPLGPPPGVGLCDQLVDMQDRLDRAERERMFAQAGKAKPGGGG